MPDHLSRFYAPPALEGGEAQCHESSLWIPVMSALGIPITNYGCWLRVISLNNTSRTKIHLGAILIYLLISYLRDALPSFLSLLHSWDRKSYRKSLSVLFIPALQPLLLNTPWSQFLRLRCGARQHLTDNPSESLTSGLFLLFPGLTDPWQRVGYDASRRRISRGQASGQCRVTST